MRWHVFHDEKNVRNEGPNTECVCFLYTFYIQVPTAAAFEIFALDMNESVCVCVAMSVYATSL